jgi:hypothetical protein
MLAIIQTTQQEVSDLLFKVDISKACGHDGVGNKILNFVILGYPRHSLSSLI